MLPFYIYYSMFGFQRVGDLIWAAADQRARGFLLGATAGRTTLGGEGLQHQDGSSHVVAATIPNCRAYDPASAGELAVILDHGSRAMIERGEGRLLLRHRDERERAAALPARGRPQPTWCAASIAAARWRGRLPRGSWGRARSSARSRRRRTFSATNWGLAAEVWSATSFSELAREAREVQRWNRLHPAEDRRASHVARSLSGEAPVIAATDYVRAYPQSIAEYVAAPFVTLGTDGFGRSDTRAALRRFFEVDRHQIVLATLDVLAAWQGIDPGAPAAAIERYGIGTERPPSWTC